MAVSAPTGFDLPDLSPEVLGRSLGLSPEGPPPASAGRGLRVLLVFPNLKGMNMLPPVVALFTALLKERGHVVDLFDTTFYRIPGFDFDSDKEKEKSLNVRPFDFGEHDVRYETDVFEDFRRKVDAFSPDLLAMTCSEDMFPIGIDLLRSLPRRPLTLLGGVFATFAPHIAIAHPEIDMVCVGEGEAALVDLCDRLARGEDVSRVTNLWVKRGDGEVIKNPLRRLADMNRNPLLDFSLFDPHRLYRPMGGKVYRMFPVETHRGCPYPCAFCNSPSLVTLYRAATHEMHFRKKEIPAVRRELLHLRDVWKAEYFYFWADTFFAYTDREFDAFCGMYEDVRVPFWCQTRPETVTEPRIRRLMDVGLKRMAFGIEHGDEKFRASHVGRRVTNEKILRALDVPAALGLPFSVNNIVGFPDETYELAMETVELNRPIRSDNINSYAFSPFHGTPLRRLSEERGYVRPGEICVSLKKGSILRMPQFPPERILGLLRTFVMYVKYPKARWPEIRRAEALTPDGDRIWERLREELAPILFAPRD